jgi:hypothetical protein
MDRFTFLDAFPEPDATEFLHAWELVEAAASKPHSREAQATLNRVMYDIASMLFTDEVKFADGTGALVTFVELSPECRQRMVEELSRGIPQDKRTEFHLNEFLGSIWREPRDAAAWSKAPVELTDDRLTIDGHQVMDAWETPIMRGMVDRCLAAYVGDERPKVLELGWGMGISGRRFLEHGVDYTVVEAHAQIAEGARQYLLDQGTVVECLWQDAEFALEAFDIVFFDVYHTTHDPERDQLRDAIDFFLPLMLDRGVFTYFLANDPEQIIDLLDRGFSKVVCDLIKGFEVPADCTYATPAMTAWFNILAIK